MEVQELLESISEDARVDMADFISVRVRQAVGGDELPSHMLHTEVYFDWPKVVSRGKTHLIKEITWNRYGYPCIKLVDSQAALRTLAQILGLLTEPDRSDPQELERQVAALRTLPKETLRELHLALLRQGTVDVPARAIPEDAAGGRG